MSPVRRHRLHRRFLFVGALYGGIAFVEVICSLVGNVVFNSVYSATLYIMTGFVYLVMAAFYAVGCLLLV